MAKIFLSVIFEAICQAIKMRIMRLLIDKTIKLVHNDMISKLIHAPVNLFYDITPCGVIMKRFTNDILQIDVLVTHFMKTTYCIFQLVYILILICYMSYWNIIIVTVIVTYICIMGFYIFEFYRNSMTIRNKQFIPILSHQSEIQKGTSTIRAL